MRIDVLWCIVVFYNDMLIKVFIPQPSPILNRSHCVRNESNGANCKYRQIEHRIAAKLLGDCAVVTIGNNYLDGQRHHCEKSLDGVECSYQHASHAVWRLGEYELKRCVFEEMDVAAFSILNYACQYTFIMHMQFMTYSIRKRSVLI